MLAEGVKRSEGQAAGAELGVRRLLAEALMLIVRVARRAGGSRRRHRASERHGVSDQRIKSPALEPHGLANQSLSSASGSIRGPGTCHLHPQSIRNSPRRRSLSSVTADRTRIYSFATPTLGDLALGSAPTMSRRS